MIRACFAAAIAAACLVTSAWAQGPLAPQSALYKELMPHFRAFEPDLAALTVKDRRPIDATADVIVVEATAPSPEPRAATAERQMRQDAFGVFVLDRATGRRRLTVDIFPTERRLDYVVKIHDVSGSRLTIGRAGGTYGDVSDQVTYFWDLAAGRIVEHLTHGYFAVTDVVEYEGLVWAVGTDGRRGAVMKFRPGDSTPLALVDRVEGRPIPPILETGIERDTLVLVGDDAVRVARRPMGRLTESRGVAAPARPPDRGRAVRSSRGHVLGRGVAGSPARRHHRSATVLRLVECRRPERAWRPAGPGYLADRRRPAISPPARSRPTRHSRDCARVA